MKTRNRSLFGALSLGLFGALACVATAAAQTPSGNASASGGASANAAAGPNGEVAFQHETKLSPTEELNQAGVFISRIEAGSQQIARQLGEAREQRDVVKTLFLNDKLSQIDVALRTARERKTSLAAAVAHNDVETANHEFLILEVLKQRADQLVAEANQAVGEGMAFIGDSETSMTVDPSIPGTDSTPYPSTDPTLVSGPPLPTSAEK